MEEMTVQDYATIRNKNQTHILLDVRDTYEATYSTIGGIQIPFMELEGRLEELDKQQQIIVYCRTGHRSVYACGLLEQAGFTQVYNLKGGINEWARQFDPDMMIY